MNKSSFLSLIENNHKIVVFIFFIIFLSIGLTVFNDYGLSWDERFYRQNGIVSFNYIFESDDSLLAYKEKEYGSAFELLLIFSEKTLNLEDSRDIFLMRHLITFLVFYLGVLFFYLLCKYYFNSWKIGLLGSLFLIESPRIFAHSFYNSRDLFALSMFIISMYTLVKYLDKKTLPWAFLLALTSAILINIRMVGVLVPFLAFIFVIVDSVLKYKSIKIRNSIFSFVLYVFLLVFFIILFWPWLWTNPFNNFIKAFKTMTFNIPGFIINLYLGSLIDSREIPWHYIPVWIVITTPILYTFSFVVGLFISIKYIFKNFLNYFKSRKRYDLIILIWFFLPLSAVIVLKSNLYDAWRLMFFIYPAFLIISLKGPISLFDISKIKFNGRVYKILNVIIIIFIAFSLVSTTQFMIKNHPFQNVYFNSLAGRDIKKNFELDYWGLSYRQALEYILRNDSEKTIKVYALNRPGEISVDILTPKERNRLEYVDLCDAKYFLSNYRDHVSNIRDYIDEYPYENEFYSISIDGVKIMVVYKLRE